jgi:ElaB/YqjD/DUF883 family membrane-anchored ribosome-binding protein
MDTRAVREELKQRKEAHQGDVAAALDDVLESVLQDVGKATAKSQQALAQADAALKRAREIGN